MSWREDGDLDAEAVRRRPTRWHKTATTYGPEVKVAVTVLFLAVVAATVRDGVTTFEFLLLLGGLPIALKILRDLWQTGWRIE